MTRLFDAFWRAAAYCLHPRVVLLSIAPLLVAGGLAFGLGWFYWEPAVDAVQALLESSTLVVTALGWLESIGLGAFRPVLAPLLVVVLALPVVVVVSLLMVALLMTPSMVKLVAVRRFPALERLHGAAAWRSALFSLWCTVLALAMLGLSLPLWLVPPMVLVLPPLIWGWLTYKVMSYDVLAEHASADERRRLVAEHRWPMLAMGVITGYLGAAPSLIWAVSAALLIFAPVLIVISIWLYTLVFAFSSLWFSHYALSALADLRRREGVPVDPAGPVLAPAGAPGADVDPLPALPPTAADSRGVLTPPRQDLP